MDKNDVEIMKKRIKIEFNNDPFESLKHLQKFILHFIEE